ncbi:MAG TPA: alpha/beta fold hydrolase, partial [bacterium]|nr:alpha/beta fold hydrolase [bacterium]
MGRESTSAAGVLLLHGFSGSPLEMTPLAAVLAAQGWTVSVARLAGHGTSPEDLARVTWSEWVTSAREAYADLRRRCGRVALIGLSMGGALALYLAASDPADAVVTISTPIRMRPLLASVWRVAAMMMPVMPIVMRMPIRDPEVRKLRSPYRKMAVVAARQLETLLAETRRVLPQVRAPLLVVQGRKDWVIPRDSAREILRLAVGSQAALVWLRQSGHVATLDRDRTVLADEVLRFLRMHLAPEGLDQPRGA